MNAQYKYFLAHPLLGEQEVSRNEWEGARRSVTSEDVDSWEPMSASGIGGRRKLITTPPTVEYVFLLDWGPIQKGRIARMVGENVPHHVRGTFFIRTPDDAPDGFNAWDGSLRLKRSAIELLADSGVIALRQE